MECNHLELFQFKQDTFSHVHGIDMDKPLAPYELIICGQCGKVLSRKEKKPVVSRLEKDGYNWS